jgi:N-sulfoglucosamine sulfohydrolase
MISDRAVRWLIVGCVVLISAASASAGDRLNILLIVSEDNGPHFACYGDRTIDTPHVDRLARDGVRFENAYVTQSVCSPSRASILTGLYPHQHGQLGLASHNFRMVGRPPHMFGLLKHAGYRTGILGKLHVNPESAFEFDLRWADANAITFRERDVVKTAEVAGRFMADRGPFFLMVNYADAHLPLLPKSHGVPKSPVSARQVKTLDGVLVDSPRLRGLTADYYSCISRLDTGIGLLMDALKQSGKLDDTLVIYVADHGPQFGRGKVTSYEFALRVPLIVRWPGLRGEARRELVSTIDLLPTVLEAAGVQPPADLPGRSLMPLLRGDVKPDWREHLFCEWNTSHAAPAPSLYMPQRSVRDDRYKLIANVTPGERNPTELYYTEQVHVDTGATQAEIDEASTDVRRAYQTWRTAPPVELYDLQRDPNETNNLADDPAMRPVRDRLEQTLQQWRQQTGDPLLDAKNVELLAAEHDRQAAVKVRKKRPAWRYPDYLFNEK